MPDRYPNFSTLAAKETEGDSYLIDLRETDSKILVMAPHGGRIEPYTTELADQIAGADFSYYTFRGEKRDRNFQLHITSTNFDEPRALQAVGKASMVLAIHGHAETSTEFVMVGGLATDAIDKLKRALDAVGFPIRVAQNNLTGKNRRNICNRGKSGEGIQFELSRKLRDNLRADEQHRQVFVETVRRILKVLDCVDESTLLRNF